MLIAFLISFSIHAEPTEKCRTTTRLDVVGQAFEKIPVYDQNKGVLRGQDICYSIVDSQLIDAWRYRHGDSLIKLSSPLSLAINHKSRLDQISPSDNYNYSGPDSAYFIGPGNPMLALIANNNKKVCDQRWLESFASLIAKSKNEFTNNSPHDFLNSTMDQIEKLGEIKGSLEKAEETLNPFYKCRVSAAVTNIRDLVAATKAALAQASPIPRVKEFMQNLCREHGIDVNIPRPAYYYGKDMSRTIQGLVATSIPVAINYCGEVLEGKHFSEANHTSVVIGQRWNGEECEY